MLRNCIEIPLEPFRLDFGIKNIYKVSLYIDEENQADIYGVISENRSRFRRAIYELLQGRYNFELYGKEGISDKTRNITAFKFKRRRNSNYRIYCKEYINEHLPNEKK